MEFFGNIADGAAQLFGLGDDGVETYAVKDAETAVDPNTTNVWDTIAASSNSTENIGRIWTDKSVFNDDYDFTGALDGTSVVKGTDSDFLVGLSAISSTSNLKSVVTNTTPLDIVLVVDTSGSMDNSAGHDMGYSYSPTYDVNNWGTYYIQVNGRWTELDHNNQGWYYGPRNNRTYVTPARWEGDTEGGRVQFYTRSNQQMSRMEALQNAANAFVDSVAAMNDGITDTAQQHRISLVKFASDENNSIGNGTDRDGYNYSQVVSDLTAYTTQNASTLKNTINSLEGEGATRADYGMHQAQRVLDGDGNLTGARTNAQKIVIFFTDGNPTTSSSWSDSVAGTAINYAYDMKQDGALVYSIGVFQGANPSDTNNDFNRYMNAVSSNYPDAECADNVNVGSFWNPQYEWRQTDDYGDLVLGDRVEGAEGEETPQYYFAASNADELNQVFEDITESLPINQGSGSPIEEVEGAAGTPGYLTFTDTLGSFMEVTGVGADNNKMYLAFADGLHEGTTSDGGNTWTFSGVVNEGNGVNTAYPEGADLSEIKVTVAKSNDLATGDIITVQIPASLIPMRNYDVDTDNGTMTVSDTFPVRLFYGVSVKDGVIDALNNPQDANHDAVLAQTSADGTTVDFYSNSFVQEAAQGTTEASFTPSDGNKFYYYPVNTQLFIDENCTEPATRNNIARYDTLYYQDSYWKLTGNGNKAEEVPTTGSITRSGNDWHVTYQNGNAYIAADTPRADRPATLVSSKGENLTGTATTVLTPTWVGNSVSQKLGNNGKLSVDAPGDLRIDKTVNWGNASSETQADKNSFKFTVHLYTVAEDGTQTNLTNQYDYAVYATGETPVSEGTVSDNGVITLEGGQYVVISDLPNGAQYTVTEQTANQNGFATTDNSTGENAKTDDGIVEGTIVGGSQQTAVFTNTYHATEVTLGGANQLIKVRKNLTGREWQDTDEFRFTMRPEGDAPAPESTDAVVVDDEDAVTDYTVNLSNITFENPGTFTYVIEEDNDTNPIAGIDYSNETYAVTITVVDNGTGKLEIQSVQFTQRADVDGNTPAEQPQITDNTVVFTNNYDATEATTNLNGTKVYTDNSGANPNTANKFTFELKAIGGYATNGGSAQNPTIGAADVPMPEGADADTHTITIGNNGTNPDGFAFQTIRYNGTHLNNTYIYEIREVIPQGATNNGDGTWSLNGMTYDGKVYTVTVEITDEPNEQGEGMHLVATPSMQPADVKFINVYDPTDYTLKGNEAIHGTKVLQGREIGENETFYFQLEQTGGPETVLADPEVKTVTKASGMDFAFSALTFSKAGTYTFTVNEVADDQGTETANGNGMTYSQNVAKVTIKVKDGGNGALVLDGPIVYENNGSDETGKAVFTNVYEAELKYGAEGKGGINVTKQLLDRPMTAGEFTFTITGEGDAADLTTNADESFQNTGAAADQTITMAKFQSLTFDETDAGKTYTFIVDETEPVEGEGLAGVSYDKSQYKVEIEVVDNGDGTMHAVTTVTQTLDKDGNEIADGGKVVVDHVNSDAVGYEVPTFGFVNDYNPNPVDMGEDANNALQVTKKVTGAPSAADYTFTLTAQDAADGSVANVKGLDENHQATVTTSGTIAAGGTQTLSFDKLTFTEPGTYTFTVQENQPEADEGWTFDTTSRTITVEVTDVNPNYEPGGNEPQYDGNLYIGDVTGNNPTIENKYDHGTVTIGAEGEAALTVEKTVKGWSTDTDFHFTFTPVEEEGVDWDTVKIAGGADKTSVTDEFADGDMHSAQFGEITFTEPGTYKFNVTEDEAQGETTDPAGWTYDDSTQTITVTVSETDADGNYDGKLHATVSGPAQFENTYKAGTATVEGGEATFAGTKVLEGRQWLENETYDFTMKPVQQDGVDWGSVGYKTDADAEAAVVTVDSSWQAEAKGNGSDSASFYFDGIFTFSKAGTYNFNVTEDAPDADGNGMTYDRHTGLITVTVTDDGTGALKPSVTYGAVTAGDGQNNMTFTNRYEADPVTWGSAEDELLGGHKYINDTTGNTYALGEGQFSFTMRAQAVNNPMPEGWDGAKDSQGRGMMTVTNGTGNATEVNVYDFGWIEFTHADMTDATAVDGQPGVYTKDFQYNIFETGNMPAGISKDNTAYTVTFKVTEDYNTGKMTVTPSAVKIINGGDGEGTTGDAVDVTKLDFTNTYNPTSISSYMNIFKTLEGRNWRQDDTFTFNVSMTATETDGSEWPQGAPLPSVDAQGSNYQISEAKTNDAGNGFDYTVTINPNSATGNTYRFDTGKITYEREGIYTYKVSEAQSTVANVTADDTEYTVVVKVTDENGALKREVTSVTPDLTNHGTGDQVFAALDFTNTYTPTASEGVPTNFALQKTFTGHEWTNDYAFEFVLSPVDGAPMPKANQDAGVTIDNEGNAHKTISAPTGDSKDTATFDFGAISYDKAGTYTYAVTEVKGNHGGVTYDTSTVNITVEVKDVAGQLVATATVVGSFTNTYKTSAEYNADGVGGLDITKQVTNHAMADGQFSFTIEATGDNAEAAAKKLDIQNGVSTEVKSAAADAGVATSVKSNPFETVSFDKSDDGVTYTYTIKENGKTGEGDYKNYVLDTNTYTVEITPTDNGDGTMTVKTVENGTEYSNQRATVAFVNSYQADPTTVGAQGAAKIEGTKTLKNDVLTDGQFTFQVKSGDVVVAEGTNDANGNITFGNITYTTENLAAAVNGGSNEVGTATAKTTDDGTEYTFNYTVSEVKPDPNTGVTANTGAQYITVTVTDDGNGTLTPAVSYDSGTSLAFENTYGGNSDFALKITGKKEIVGGQTNPTNIPTLKGGEYEFTIIGTPAEDGTPAPMPATKTVKNGAAGGVTFEDIHYTMANTFGNKPATTNAYADAMADEATTDEVTTDEGIETYTAGRTQVFTYTISESGSVAGVTNEQGTKTVQVTVTDLGGGKLEAKVTSEKVDGADFKFTNVYDVTETTSSLTGNGGFTITKDFSSTNTDRTLTKGDFEFQLKGGDTVITATNAADGTVSFGGITFTKPGTYNYVLSEVDGGKPGVDYDTTGYNVTAKAEDMGDGTLKVTWEMPQAVDGGVTFANTYTAANTGITFKAAKVLDGRELTDGEFTFELRENGKVIDTATNDADGTVAFEKVEYTESGAHDYEIAEVKGDDSTITYDDTVFTVHVNVVDNTQTGSLDASDWSYGENGSPVFHNTYTEPPAPVEPDEVIPATGDAAVAAVAATVAIGGTLVAAGYVTSKKRGE
ncbi:VWA domain-containing protein [Collinsella intestinalis]|nr:VWA domain-containing protein [Collinsella intestinalis]